MEDNEIIRLYHERDENAIAQTDLAHGAFCRGLAFHLLSNREDVEECVNDTWMAAWTRMPPDWPMSLRAFLGRITRNLSISRFRKNKAIKRHAGIEVMLSELEECVPDSAVELQIEQKLLSEIISRWLDSLDGEDRALFIRRYWYADTVRELAGECGVTANQMAKRMQRLRESLRQALQREGVEV